MSAERVMMLVCGLCIGAAAVAEDAEDGEAVPEAVGLGPGQQDHEVVVEFRRPHVVAEGE